ncbi:gb [Venturia nashicola]|uniref:Gb n=1 Tax=Venturia nashicola TaxID=86259 RepID=A0A4Z1NSU3_9PEZI|nr:gb [Venturia nashicola]TLD19439.1 gb [Venturia nashicola]
MAASNTNRHHGQSHPWPNSLPSQLPIPDHDRPEFDESLDEESLLLQDDVRGSRPPPYLSHVEADQLPQDCSSRPLSECFDELSLRESLLNLNEHGRTYTRDEASSESSAYTFEETSTDHRLLRLHAAQRQRAYNSHGRDNQHQLTKTRQKEHRRLEIQYLIITALMRGNHYLAPLRKNSRHAPKRILDMGCGTGVWCFDMAKEFRNARIVGIDIDRAAWTSRPLPDNVTLARGNMHKDPWGGPYDFIHTRFMLGTAPNFKTVIQEAYDNLEPGGWMESQELWPKSGCDDDTMPTDFILKEWEEFQHKVAMNGAPVRIADKLRRWFKEVGFVDVQQEIFKIPLNGWPKDPRLHVLGRNWCEQLCDGMEAFTMKYFTSYPLYWTPTEVTVYLAQVRTAIKDKNVHGYHRIFVVWGRKPTREEQAAQAAANSGSSGKKPVANSSL